MDLLQLSGRREGSPKCPKCKDTGWLVESKMIGQHGWSLSGGPCRCIAGIVARPLSILRAHPGDQSGVLNKGGDRG